MNQFDSTESLEIRQSRSELRRHVARLLNLAGGLGVELTVYHLRRAHDLLALPNDRNVLLDGGSNR